MKRKTCHDCGCLEGQLHDPGCDMERCPLCGNQSISCECPNADLFDVTRVPFIEYPSICAKCGKLWPDVFMVPYKEWTKYIEPAMQDKILCRSCYDFIRKVIDKEEKTA